MPMHLALMDEDPVAIITPLLDPNIATGSLMLAHTSKQTAKAQRLLKIISHYGISSQTWLLPDTFSTDELMDSFQALAETHKAKEVWLNASGGARYAMLAATCVSQIYDHKIYVVEPEADTLSWLSPSEAKPTPLADKLSLNNLLQLFDTQVTDNGRRTGLAQDVREVGAQWAAKANDYSGALARLNWLAMKSRTLTSPILDSHLLDDQHLMNIIEDLTQIGYVDFADNRLHFANESSRFFANGGWLEDHVFATLYQLRAEFPQIQDLAQGVTVNRKLAKGSVDNELDIAFVANNKLHIIECKTKKFAAGDAQATSYKLDALTDALGGIEAKSLLVSYRELSEYEMLRAQAQNIHVIAGRKLPQLKHHLRLWINHTLYN